MLEWIINIYQEPLFFYFIICTNLIALGTFLSLSIPMTILAVKTPEFLKKYRIQQRKVDHPDVIRKSVKQLMINVLFTLSMSALSWPWLRLTGIHMGPLPPWYVILASVLFFAVLDDFLYYWVHRYLHINKWLYRKVHAVHHRIPSPIAISGNYMHPVEYLIISSLVLVGPILLGAHVVTIWIWIIIRQWEAAEQHNGFDISWNPTHLLPFYDGAAFHDFHHSKFLGNYSGLFTYADTLFKTRAKKYDEYLDSRSQDSVKIDDPYSNTL